MKSNEQNGVIDPSELAKGPQTGPGGNKHAPSAGPAQSGSGNILAGNGGQNSSSGSLANANANSASKRGSSGHRRDKASRDKHTDRNGEYEMEKSILIVKYFINNSVKLKISSFQCTTQYRRGQT